MLMAFKWLWDQVNVWGLVALGVIAFLFKYGNDKKNEGAASVVHEMNKESEKVRDAWDEIDRGAISVDSALERLSDRNKS